MFKEQDASFEPPRAANQYRRTSSVCQGICSNEVFRLGGEIIFLATMAPQVANLGHPGVQFPIADHQFQVSFVVAKDWDGKGIAA
jgi:hypothetical protein